MQRREFLKSMAGMVASSAVAKSLPQLKPRSTRPNVIVIMSDEHNAGILGAYGNSLIQTPNLDNLAANGVTFESAYCASPICVPSRLAFTAGQYASRIGAWDNFCWLPSDSTPSIASLMNSYGYDALLCGRQHYDYRRRYGFREIGNIRPNLNKYTKTGVGDARRAPDRLTPQPGVSPRFNGFYEGNDSYVLEHDAAVSATAAEFLENRSVSDKPFFLFVGYTAPHFPLIVPSRYRDPYRGQVPLPQIPDGHLDNLPLNYQHLRIAFNVEDVSDHTVNKGRELYYGLTQWLDEQIGTVLNSLNDSELADNTVVIYTSDHGENMGEHGLWWKSSMYEHSARVPLIVSWPARWAGGQRRLGACSLLDVVQTIAELGEAPTPDYWDGDSMATWLDDPATDWKDQAVSEYYAHGITSGYTMLRTGNHKYVYHTSPSDAHPIQRELYDLESDPGEFLNLALDSNNETLLTSLHAQLVAELGESIEDIELRCRSEHRIAYDRHYKAHLPILSGS